MAGWWMPLGVTAPFLSQPCREAQARFRRWMPLGVTDPFLSPACGGRRRGAFPRVLGNSNCAGVSELGSSSASPSPALPVNGEGVSPRFLGAAVSPGPNDGRAIMSCCGGSPLLIPPRAGERKGAVMLAQAKHLKPRQTKTPQSHPCPSPTSPRRGDAVRRPPKSRPTRTLRSHP